MDQAVQIQIQMTNIICLHVCLYIDFLWSGFQISYKNFGWTAWILLQEVQLQIRRQITKNCLYVFQLVVNLDIKTNILSLGRTQCMIWRLSRYGL